EPPHAPAWLPRGFRTLRWRLAVFYIATLAALVLVMGAALNVVIGRVPFAEELTSFQAQSRLTVARQLTRFDTLVQGRQIGGTSGDPTAVRCAAQVSYQQAFAEAIATPLAYQRSYHSAYLLDQFGNVLSAPDDLSATNGAQAPYLTASQLSALQARLTARPNAAGVLGEVAYPITTAAGDRYGVVLLAERIRTASTCGGAPGATIVAIIEVVTDFRQTAATLALLRAVVVVVVAGVFLVAVALGAPLISRALAPLTRMTATARLIARGDLSQRVRLPHGGDEIGQLADAFDEMIGRIEHAFGIQARSEARMRQFIADASHELRTPLTAIRGYSDVLLRGAGRDDPDAVAQVLVATRREAERMTRLVNDLLTLARLDEGRPLEKQPVDLIALVGEAVDQARVLAGGAEVALATDGGGRLMLTLDPDRIKQVLLVLLDNALKYRRPAPDAWVRVRVGRTDHGAVVSVADNGRGIAAAELPHIFDRFYRGERYAGERRITGAQIAARMPEPPAPADGSNGGAPAGSGLGLSIAQAIAQAHGGTLSVESAPGLGTTFTLALPRG
ncbi:MAG TPA: HAMP domain-containing sensor histidine kinase, partial [Ktedonobacterales bacterium]|nr:HAMP domain-containing sensor histidine kinase [Ktedonobacterales bacterium]